MPDVTTDALVPATFAADVYRKLRDFGAYPRYTDAVREVKVVTLGDHSVETRWSVNFRNGVLCWTERDTFDDAARTIAFTQIDGDFHLFDGSWAVCQDGPDVRVRFACTFDLGMPSLAAIVNPIACEALVENIQLILHGLLGDDVAFHDANAPVLAAALEG
ncbi:type II toxin-antitoxin system RatA family toxin [Micromonospora sp. NPDC050417]|uniref:type II toxin-antitoxin system RatA family toxin n=1 Tax=Micromonospora sp. NPDC050417 TaxID=3364280 RepID=UPI0037928849